MQLWLSGSCALLFRVRLRLWLWPVYCPPDFIAHFRVLVVAGMWIWLWWVRSVLLIQAKKKLGHQAEFSHFTYSYLTLAFRVDQRHDHLDQHLFNSSRFQWHFPLFLYIQTMIMLPCTGKYVSRYPSPANSNASLLLRKTSSTY